MLTVTLSCVGLYLLLMLALGLRAFLRRKNTLEDYILAGRSVSWIHLGLTYFATWFSTFAFLGAPGFFYKQGASWLLVMGFINCGTPLLIWLVGRRVWALGRIRGYITPADMLADRFGGNSVRMITAIVSLLALVPYCLIQIVGIGKVLAVSTHGVVTYDSGVLVAACVTAIYLFAGGIRAVIWTDSVQGLFFLSVLIIAAVVVVVNTADLQLSLAYSQSAHPDRFALDMNSVGAPLSLAAAWYCGALVLPHMWQRSYMARSSREFSRGVMLHSVMTITLVSLTMLVGFLAMPLVEELKDSDTLLPHLFQHYAPWATPLLIVAVFAAGMSTIDSQLLTASSVIVRDLLQRDDKRASMLSRLFSVGFIAALAMLAMQPESQGSIILLASKGTGIASILIVPLFGALFTKNPSRLAAVSSLIIGEGTLALLEITSAKLPLSFAPSFAGLLAAVAVYALVSPLDRRKQHQRHWFSLSTPITNEVKRAA